MFETVHHFQQLSSCVGSNSCGIGSPVNFGATTINSANVHENWLVDDIQSAATTYSMTGSDQGMFNDYAAIATCWYDTTNMDNLRGADITDHSIAGSLETIGLNNNPLRNNAGHSVHTPSGGLCGGGGGGGGGGYDSGYDSDDYMA
jgi:hypothetical protein